MHPRSKEDQFSEEILRLFADEASGWLGQIKKALSEMESRSVVPRGAKEYETVLRCLTNLKGSAATVELPAMEKLANLLVPLAQSLRNKDFAASPALFATLGKGIETLAAVVHVLEVADSKTNVLVDLESISRKQVDALKQAIALLPKPSDDALFALAGEEKSEGIEADTILKTLVDLKPSRSLSVEQSRNSVESLLRIAHRILDEESTPFSTAVLMNVLQDLDMLDVKFLKETRRRMRMINGVLAGLVDPEGDSAQRLKTIKLALREVSLLHKTARVVDATEVIGFLHGLESLLQEVAYKRAPLPANRIQAVSLRLDQLLTKVQEWVDAGRAERGTIERTLTQLKKTHFMPMKEASASLQA